MVVGCALRCNALLRAGLFCALSCYLGDYHGEVRKEEESGGCSNENCIASKR